MAVDDIRRLDRSDMLGTVASMPVQLRKGLEIGREAWKGLGDAAPREMVVAGMGGSAIGADVLRAYLSDTCTRPVLVNRDYVLPGFVGPGTLLVVSSYSGDTEETLACLEDGLRRGANPVCISTDGALLERAEAGGLRHARIPAGLPPRGALGYSFAPLYALACEVGLCEYDEGEYAECIEVLERIIPAYADRGNRNEALALAERLVDRLPLVYCSNSIDTVGVRWKGQFSENSKKLAYAGVLPEMNHNEIMGWEIGDESLKPGVVLLRYAGDGERMVRRFDFLKEVVKGRNALCGDYAGTGKGLLSQMFSLIVLGDYVSVYLALLRGVDPTPIVTIAKLKARLKES